jgi:hypothetical protein
MEVVSRQAKGGMARASRAKFFSQMSLLEDRFRLNADEKARLQRLANVIYETFTWSDVCQIFCVEHEAETANLTEQMHKEQREAKARCDVVTLELTQLQAAFTDLQRLHATAFRDPSESKAADGSSGSDPAQCTTRTERSAKHTKVKQKLSRLVKAS